MTDEKRDAGDRRVSRYRLDDLKGQDDNPKAHDLLAIERSLRQYGYVEPVAFDTLTRRVVAGHGRIEALRRMRDASHCSECNAPIQMSQRACDECGSPRVPKNVSLLDDGEWEIEVVGHRFASKMESRSYVVVSNRTGQLGGWADNYGEYLGQFADDPKFVRAMSLGDEEFRKLDRHDGTESSTTRGGGGAQRGHPARPVGTTRETGRADDDAGPSGVDGESPLSEEETVRMTFVVTPSQQENIERAMAVVRVRERGLRGSMLSAICREWLRAQVSSDVA